VFLSPDDFGPFKASAETIVKRMPGLLVIAVARSVHPLELMPKILHLGVRQLLTTPVAHDKLAEVVAAITKQLALTPAPVPRPGDLYAFFPAKPAVSTSCALADELHVGTLVMDCDLMAGCTKLLLKLGNTSPCNILVN
jgi:hypothetical protein